MPASQKCNAVTGIRAAGPPSGGSHGKAGGKGSPLQGEYRMSINIGPPQVDELKPRIAVIGVGGAGGNRSEEHTSELQSLMRISYAVFCLKKKKRQRDIFIRRP